MKTRNTLAAAGLFIAGAATTSLLAFTGTGKQVQDYQYLQVTTVESVVPGGLGRSRMVTIDESGKMSEINLENFFSLVGINFSNIRHNDQLITDKIGDLSKQGWELVQVTPGVYGADKSTGIFITRYLFRK